MSPKDDKKPAAPKPPKPKKPAAPKIKNPTLPPTVTKAKPVLARDIKGTYFIVAKNRDGYVVAWWDGQRKWMTEETRAGKYQTASAAELDLKRIPRSKLPKGALRMTLVGSY